MPHRARNESRTGIYHVYVRGINRELVFGQVREKNYFIKILKKHLKEYEVEIYAYCIMSNHAHFIIKSEIIQEMSMFMSKILAEYANYYNYKKNRNGHVFQGRFKSECIEDMNYFWTCLKYIHMNPVKAQMISAAWEYKYSSINEYKKSKSSIIHENALCLYKTRFDEWQQFIEFHYGRGVKVFLGTEEEIYYQQKEMAWEILQETGEKEGVDHLCEIFEEPEKRKRFLKKVKEQMALSESKMQKIYKELKKEVIV